jgi:mRNA interferase RelE/StbE
VNFKLVYTKRAVKDIQSLDNNVRKRIGKALIRYREDPLKKAEKLTDFAFGTFKRNIIRIDNPNGLTVVSVLSLTVRY